MILPKFDYKNAEDIAAAIALYESSKGRARYLVGGTDLVPLVKLRLFTPGAMIDLKGIAQGIRRGVRIDIWAISWLILESGKHLDFERSTPYNSV